jgi:DNA-binding NarL/FixJ family response regulator
VDRDAMFRSGIARLLENAGVSVAGEAESVEEATSRCAELDPDVVLIASRLRGTSGIEAIRRICEGAPRRRVLVIGSSSDSGSVEGALRAGAWGYLLKDDPQEEIVAGVRAALDGGLPISPRAAAKLLGHLRERDQGRVPAHGLTTRELSVLKLLAAGRSNSEIGAELSISGSTVSRHLSHVFEKLAVENRTQAAVEAIRRGVL